VAPGFSGPERLSPMIVESWARGRRISLSGFEFQTLLDMSEAYVEMIYQGADLSCVPPFGDSELSIDRSAVSKKIENQFRSYLDSRKK
jgi:hypothetical protein